MNEPEEYNIKSSDELERWPAKEDIDSFWISFWNELYEQTNIS
jgi:hypothetical protein